MPLLFTPRPCSHGLATLLTSLRVLAIVHGVKLSVTVQQHPLYDKLLLEEELHVASRLGIGSLVLDVSAYVFCLTQDPAILDVYVSFQYNPDFFKWLHPKLSEVTSTSSLVSTPRPSPSPVPPLHQTESSKTIPHTHSSKPASLGQETTSPVGTLGSDSTQETQEPCNPHAPVKPKSPSKQEPKSNEQLPTTAVTPKSTDMSISTSNQNVELQQSRLPAATNPTHPAKEQTPNPSKSSATSTQPKKSNESATLKSSPTRPKPPTQLTSKLQLRPLTEMAAETARTENRSVTACLKDLSDRIKFFALIYAQHDVGVLPEELAEFLEYPLSLEEQAHLSDQYTDHIENLLRHIPDEEAEQRRLAATFKNTLAEPTDEEITALELKGKGCSPFEQAWYAMRISTAELGSELMTISEQRRAIWKSQIDPTYIASTSLRVLATSRGVPLAGPLLDLPLLDKVLTEQELHVASRLNQGGLILDVAVYLTLFATKPHAFDTYAALQYNPDFYEWLTSRQNDPVS